MEIYWGQMTVEERENHYKSLRIAASREMESWDKQMKMEREKSDSNFSFECQEKKKYDEAQSSARRAMGKMSSIGERFWEGPSIHP